MIQDLQPDRHGSVDQANGFFRIDRKDSSPVIKAAGGKNK
jgi:hypothetical protein